MDAGVGITRAPWKDAVGQIFIGSQPWVESMRSLIEVKPRSNDHPAMQRYAPRPRPAKIVDVVAEVFETTPQEIRNSHGTVERRVAAWLGCYEGQSRLGAIGTVLRLRSTGRVSQLIAECDHDVDRKEQKHLRIAIDRCLDLLRRDMKPVMPRFAVSYPAITPLSALTRSAAPPYVARSPGTPATALPTTLNGDARLAGQRGSRVRPSESARRIQRLPTDDPRHQE